MGGVKLGLQKIPGRSLSDGALKKFPADPREVEEMNADEEPQGIFSIRKNPHAHKNKIGTSTPPPPFQETRSPKPPKRRNFMGRWEGGGWERGGGFGQGFKGVETGLGLEGNGGWPGWGEGGGGLETGVFQQKRTKKCQAPIKLAQPFPVPKLRVEKIRT